MTDTVNPPQVSLDLNALQSAGKEIAALDERISAASGSEAAIKTSVFNKLLADNSDTVASIVDTLLKEMNNLPDQILVALRHRLPDAMDEVFQERVDSIVDGQVEALTSSVKGNVEPLKEERKAKLEMFKAMRAILNQYGIDTASVPDPKRSGGRPAGSSNSASTPTRTGKNNEGYRYYMDGQPRPKSQNSFSSLAFYATMKCAGTEDAPARWSTKELKDFVAQKGVKWGPPGDDHTDEWELTLPNGTKIGARRFDAVQDKDIFDAVAKAEAEENKSDDTSTPDDAVSESEKTESVEA